MTCQQLYYTSCQRGRDAGFQTLAQSAGLGAEVVRQIERLLFYPPPVGLPAATTPEQIREFCPVKFGFDCLQDGRLAVYQSCYLGKDYSNRPGNYFGHAIVFEPGPAPVRPAQLWKWSRFRIAAPELEAAVAEGGRVRLPELEVADWSAEVTLSEAELGTFATGAGHGATLQRMLEALFQGRENGRRILLYASAAEAIRCIAALQFALPLTWVEALTFCTCAPDPSSGTAAVMVVPRAGGGFRLGATERAHTYFVFDLEEGESRPPEVENPLARRLVARVPGPALDGVEEWAPRLRTPSNWAQLQAAVEVCDLFSGHHPAPDLGTFEQGLALLRTQAAAEAGPTLLSHLAGRLAAFLAKMGPEERIAGLARLIRHCPSRQDSALVMHLLGNETVCFEVCCSALAQAWEPSPLTRLLVAAQEAPALREHARFLDLVQETALVEFGHLRRAVADSRLADMRSQLAEPFSGPSADTVWVHIYCAYLRACRRRGEIVRLSLVALEQVGSHWFCPSAGRVLLQTLEGALDPNQLPLRMTSGCLTRLQRLKANSGLKTVPDVLRLVCALKEMRRGRRSAGATCNWQELADHVQALSDDRWSEFAHAFARAFAVGGPNSDDFGQFLLALTAGKANRQEALVGWLTVMLSPSAVPFSRCRKRLWPWLRFLFASPSYQPSWAKEIQRGLENLSRTQRRILSENAANGPWTLPRREQFSALLDSLPPAPGILRRLVGAFKGIKLPWRGGAAAEPGRPKAVS